MAEQREHPGQYLTIRQMATELGVSQEKVRYWCACGMIRGAVNIGDKARTFWRVLPAAWDAFKAERAQRNAPPAIPPTTLRLLGRRRTGTNLLGI